MVDATQDDPSQLRNRVDAVKYWIAIGGDRRVVSGIVLSLIFVVTVVIGSITPSVTTQFLQGANTPGTGFLYLLTGIITLVTIVLTINQLVLSHQIGPIENQETALQSLLPYREEVGELVDSAVLPEQPSAFLTLLLSGIKTQVDKTVPLLESDEVSTDQRERIRELLDDIHGNIEQTQDELEPAVFKNPAFVAAMERFRGPEHLRKIRYLLRMSDEIPDTLDERLQKIGHSLELFITIGNHLKIGHTQTQFIALSRSLLYISVPALIITYYGAVLYTPDIIPGTTLGINHTLLFTAAVLTVSVSPFVFLVSYMFRLTTLAKTTVFSGPFKRGEETSPFIRDSDQT